MNNQFDVKLGETMRKFRERKGATIIDVADALNVSKVSVHYWESGKRQINASTLKEYCAYLGIKVQTLFDEMDGIES